MWDQFIDQRSMRVSGIQLDELVSFDVKSFYTFVLVVENRYMHMQICCSVSSLR